MTSLGLPLVTPSVTEPARAPPEKPPSSAWVSTSGIRDTGMISIPARTFAGTSASTSGRFRAGTRTRVKPSRCAAMIFSLTPPIGSTSPESVISPVIAVSERARRPEKSDTIAVQMVMPAEGPSLGTAPCGKWTWMSWRLMSLPSRPSWSACARTHERAMLTLSLITAPSLPVVTRLPFPSMRVASTCITSPPTLVHTSPATTPGELTRSASSFSRSKRRGPRTFSTIGTVAWIGLFGSARACGSWRSSAPSAGAGADSICAVGGDCCSIGACDAICTAAARHRLAIARSSPRTPASRV
mmetsp:Transcript_29064/g.94902  ORF Transcript_29064/g.94902 Transcript_29064/m.94902 type:complete len:299 (-) Transcript_29064:2863-3759(-)